MPNDYAEKIKEARLAGYSDDEIASLYAQHDPKLAAAMKEGYSGSEILSGLGDPSAYAAQQAKTSVAGPLQRAGREQLAGMNPQDRYVQGLPEDQRKAAQQKLESGMSMTVPEMLLTMGTMSPAASVAKLGIKGAAKQLGRTTARGIAGAYTGSEIGAHGGGQIGKLVGNEEAGRQVGGIVGALSGGTAALKSPAYLSKLPLGAGRMLMSEEEYAAAISARKLTQRNSDIAAGLRKAPVVKAEPIDTPRVKGTAGGANAGAAQEVLVVPERAFDVEPQSGSKWSVPRETLPGRALRGEAGTGQVLQKVGENPLLVESRPVIGGSRNRFAEANYNEQLKSGEVMQNTGRMQNAARFEPASPEVIKMAESVGVRADGTSPMGTAQFTDARGHTIDLNPAKVTPETIRAAFAAKADPPSVVDSWTAFRRGVK